MINSYNNIPKLHISTLKSYISLPTISGAIYSIVPQNVALLFTFNSFAQPKSHNFKALFSSIKIFSGLISLCIILFWCRKYTALTIWIKYSNAFNSSRPLVFCIKSNKLPFSAYSNKIWISFSVSFILYNLIILGWFNLECISTSFCTNLQSEYICINLFLFITFKAYFLLLNLFVTK